MTDRDKLIELIHDGVGCPDGRHPFGDVCDGCKYFPSLDCNTERLADSLIANGVVISKNETTTRRWIPVTERLPEERKDLLVFGYYHEAFQILICHYRSDFNGEWFTSVAGQKVYDVTHWMPLPSAPEEV